MELRSKHKKYRKSEMIKLYVKKGCPYCRKVISRIVELNLKEGIDYKVIDAAPETPGRTVVLEKGGKGQVPFMIDDNIHIYESDNIVSYIERKFGK